MKKINHYFTLATVTASQTEKQMLIKSQCTFSHYKEEQYQGSRSKTRQEHTCVTYPQTQVPFPGLHCHNFDFH